MHSVFVNDSRKMMQLDNNSIDLVVTSPPYPMIEMWDELFTNLNEEIGELLENNEGQKAFELMHFELNKVWSEIQRVLVDGGIACINIGDATRKLHDGFRVYQNHCKIIENFSELGFEPLPEIIWRKPVNSAAKFMGSGMIPPNAYVTLEHEYILVFRNGKSTRNFEPKSEKRYKSAYFWEERNNWFSDLWENIKGESQDLDHTELRNRSAAYPFEIPHRLINMYSVQGDTVLDPFWGTGTTSIASMVSTRNSVAYELDEEFIHVFSDRIEDISEFSRMVANDRIENHKSFVENNTDKYDFKYTSENYDFPVQTKQEKQIQFYTIENIINENHEYIATHKPYISD